MTDKPSTEPIVIDVDDPNLPPRIRDAIAQLGTSSPTAQTTAEALPSSSTAVDEIVQYARKSAGLLHESAVDKADAMRDVKLNEQAERIRESDLSEFDNSLVSSTSRPIVVCSKIHMAPPGDDILVEGSNVTLRGDVEGLIHRPER